MKKILQFLLIALTLLALTGCGSTGGYKTLDVFAQMDETSIQEIDGVVRFCAATEEGSTVTFRVKNGTVSKEGITLEPGGSILALDATGAIYSYEITTGDSEDDENWLDVGGGYSFTETASGEMKASCFILLYLAVVLWIGAKMLNSM